MCVSSPVALSSSSLEDRRSEVKPVTSWRMGVRIVVGVGGWVVLMDMVVLPCLRGMVDGDDG